MKIRKLIVLTLFFLVIGFAAVATNLIMRGTSMFGTNIDDFDVYFSEAIIDGEDYTNEIISIDRKTIIFNIDEFRYAGDTSTLEYEVTNASTSYDAEVRVECEGETEEISIAQNPSEQIIKAREVGKGTLTLTLNKTVVEEKEIEYTCRLVVNATERDSIDDTELAIPDTYVIEGNYVDEEGNPISNANLVIYSEEPHYVTTDSKGYLFYNGLEKGAHEIYYVDDTLDNIKKMSKEDVIENSTTKSSFTTSTEKEIIFGDNSKLNNGVVLNLNDYCEYIEGREWKFDYTGTEQEFLTICSGIYKIELWGAQGGDFDFYLGGKGAYTVGDIILEKKDIIFITVGGEGHIPISILNSTGPFNGAGGTVGSPTGNMYFNIGATGGSATDVRLVSGNYYNYSVTNALISDFVSLKSRIMVAAGGGGSSYGDIDNWNAYGLGGHGGALVGGNGTSSYFPNNFSYGGSQTSGGNGYVATSNHAASIYVNGKFAIGGGQGWAPWGGGGSGYYGGGSGGGWTGGGAGGSSFISGHAGCDAITENSTESNIVHTGQPNHYSGYVFTNTQMIAGNESMPTHDGTGTMIGNSRNGYAKITLVSLN